MKLGDAGVPEKRERLRNARRQMRQAILRTYRSWEYPQVFYMQIYRDPSDTGASKGDVFPEERRHQN